MQQRESFVTFSSHQVQLAKHQCVETLGKTANDAVTNFAKEDDENDESDDDEQAVKCKQR